MSRSENVQRFIDAGLALAKTGYTRTQMYDLLRDSLPESQYVQHLRAVESRDLKIFRDFMTGADVRDLRSTYQLKSLNYRDGIGKGLKRIKKILGLSETLREMLAGLETDEGREFWLERAVRALEQVKEED